MVQIPKQKRKKWDAKSRECLLTGFDEETKGYRLYDPKTRSTIISREVVFLDEGVSAIVKEGTEALGAAVERQAVIRLDLEQPGEVPLQTEF